jgi:hypothetical protein
MELQGPDLDRMKLYVYRRPLHPELFSIFLERRIDTGQYEAELRIIGTGHLISFHCGNSSVTELLTSRRDFLPDKGLLEDFSLERNQEYQVCYDNQIYYMVNVQAEEMSAVVFGSVYEEMAKFARTRGLFIAFDHWAAEGHLPPFGFIDYERRPSELDVFTYHAFPDRKVLLRTQSIFSLDPISTDPGARPEGAFDPKKE